MLLYKFMYRVPSFTIRTLMFADKTAPESAQTQTQQYKFIEGESEQINAEALRPEEGCLIIKNNNSLNLNTDVVTWM